MILWKSNFTTVFSSVCKLSHSKIWFNSVQSEWDAKLKSISVAFDIQYWMKSYLKVKKKFSIKKLLSQTERVGGGWGSTMECAGTVERSNLRWSKISKGRRGKRRNSWYKANARQKKGHNNTKVEIAGTEQMLVNSCGSRYSRSSYLRICLFTYKNSHKIGLKCDILSQNML